jgi:hypothetical protein
MRPSSPSGDFRAPKGRQWAIRPFFHDAAIALATPTVAKRTGDPHVWIARSVKRDRVGPNSAGLQFGLSSKSSTVLP